MRRIAPFCAVLVALGTQATLWAQDNPAKKLSDGVYAVLRDDLKEKHVLPLKDGEVLVVHHHRYLKKDEKQPPRYVALRRTPDVKLDLAGKPRAVKEGDGGLRIQLKLEPKAAAA